MSELLRLSRRALILGATIAAAAMIAGVTPAEAATSKLKIIFPTPPTTYGIPYYIAHDKGWFKDMDLELEDLHLIGDANSVRTLVSGGGDVVLVGPSTTMLSIQGGSGIKAIGSWQPRVDYQLVGNRDMNITKIGDIVGKKMAGGGGVSMLNHMTSMILKINGFDPKVEFVPVGGHADRLAAVIAGKGAYSLVNTLHATMAAEQINWITPVAKQLGGLGYVYLAVRGDDLKDPAQREAFAKFMKGSIMGARYAIQHPDEAAAALHKRTPDVDLGLIKKVVAVLNSIPVWGVNGGIPNEVTEFTSEKYLEYGVLKKAISRDQVLDTSIVEPIIKELGSF